MDSRSDLGAFKKDRQVYDFRVANLYTDSDGGVVGAKFWHVPSGMPIVVLQIETVPQAYMWVDTPISSDRGLPHALEHLLAEKGAKGRYFTLLRDMRLSRSAAATWRDFNFYSFSSGSGLQGFWEVFHAWLDALFHPDFTDSEAEREFYHFNVSTDPKTGARTLTEGGTVYNEEQTKQPEESCFFKFSRQVLGQANPLAANIGGDPDQMRDVTPSEIRKFHSEHYRLGPNSGFIFAFNPEENVVAFLHRLSDELSTIKTDHARLPAPREPGQFKYPIHPSQDKSPQVCNVPGADAAPGQIWFFWPPEKIDSMVHLNLLRLLFQALADGQRSLLYKSIIDSKSREIEIGATNVALDPSPSASPRFLTWNVAVSGIAGNRISPETIDQVRNLVLSKIKEVSAYPDHSEALTSFNSLVNSYLQAHMRSDRVWRRNAPLFGVRLDADWKDFLDYLEMDPSFQKSLSQDELWRKIEGELKSGRNIWRELIDQFQLLDPPYASATRSSSQLLKELEAAKQERISNKITSLEAHYQVKTAAEALARFDRDESAKTAEIDQIESRIAKPHFTDNPPLTPDDGIRYSQFQVEGVPSTAVLFDRPPTLELGLAFDLHQIPRKYYKYFPILARSFDSLGLKENGRIVPYSELLRESRARFLEFAAGTANNPVSHREDFTFRISVTTVPEFRDALRWTRKVLFSSYLDSANLGRLRDIVAARLAADASYMKQNEISWVYTPAQAFRYQDDNLYLALDSQFTRAHWDGRLYWLLHEPVTPEEIDRLGAFASRILSTAKGASRSDLDKELSAINGSGLEKELIQYWRRNLINFPESGLVAGLQRLTLEVQEDLRIGPARTIKEIKELQQLVVNRRALHLDLLISPSALDSLRPDLKKFLDSMPDTSLSKPAVAARATNSTGHPIVDKLVQESSLLKPQFPWYLALSAPDELAGNAIFYSDFINYSHTDRDSLIRLLAIGILAGRGPQGLYMKSREAGLSYNLLMRANPARGQLGYYADKVSDLPSLVSAMNSQVEQVSHIKDSYLVDYALRQNFEIPRSIYTFSIRERAFAQDIRDGITPEKIRRFNQALLKLRSDPDLLGKITDAAGESFCGVLLQERCKPQQKVLHSIFFFVGSDDVLSNAERRLPVPKLLRIWPSDYWLP